MTKSLDNEYPFHCPALFNSITTYPNGIYMPCCYAQQRNAPVGATSEQYFDSDYRKGMIAAFESGQWPTECSRCQTVEDSNGWSKRKAEWHKHFQRHPGDFAIETYNKKLATIDLRLSNLCNQACVFCNSVNSSKIEDEVIKYGDKHVDNIYHNYEMFKDLDFRNSWHLDEIKKLFTEYEIDEPCRLYMTGGEPSLLKMNMDILEFIVEQNIQDKFYLDINTNHQSWNPKFFDFAKKFKGRCLSSIDATDNTVNYIRYHSTWDNTLNNVLRFHREFPHWRKSLSPAVFILNINNLSNMIKWSVEHDVNIGLYNVLAKPHWLDMRLLPEDIRFGIADKLEELKEKHYNWDFRKIQKEKNWDQDTNIGLTNIQNILRADQAQFIKDKVTGELWTLKDTAEQLDRIDIIRNINWRQTFPWLSEIINRETQ